MPNQKAPQSFWLTIPGVLTGCAAVITAIATIIGALYTAKLIGNSLPESSPEIIETNTPASVPIVTTKVMDSPTEVIIPESDTPKSVSPTPVQAPTERPPDTPSPTIETNTLPPPEDIIKVSGVWITPFNNLSYEFTQFSHQVIWTIRETGAKGTCTINGNNITLTLNGEEVVYSVGGWASERNPTVLFTTNEKFYNIILFRSCEDLRVFLKQLKIVLPKQATIIENNFKKLNNFTCPEILN